MDDRDPFTREVIGAAIEVHREMGPGLLESVYQTCLTEEFRLRGMTVLPLHRIPLNYKGNTLESELILDFYFPEQLILEIKAVDKPNPVFEAQLLSYMRLTRTRVGLLINFHYPCCETGLNERYFKLFFSVFLCLCG